MFSTDFDQALLTTKSSMPKQKSAFILAIASLVTAQKPAPYAVPANGQIGVIHFPLACHTLGIVPVTLDAVFTATLSVYGQSGQHAYLDDVTASLTIPHSLTSIAGLVGGSQADILVHVDLDVVNGAPSTLPVFPNGYWINNTQFNSTGDTTFKVPASGVLPPIGPIVLGTANNAMEVYFGAINATVYLQNTKGNQVLVPLDIQCPVPNPSALLAIINVEAATSRSLPPLKPSLGYAPDFPTQAIGSEYGFYNFDLACDSGSHGIFGFQLVPAGAVPSVAKPKSTFNITDVTAYLTVNSSNIHSIMKIFPTASSVNVTVESFFLGITSATPSAINGISQPFSVQAKLPPSGNLTIDIPLNAPSSALNVGPLTAGTAVGTQMYLSFENATASVAAHDSNGKSVGNILFKCTPRKSTLLIGILITNQNLPHYTS